MASSYFSQFMSPSYLGIPLVLIALAFPTVLLPTPSRRWINNRLLTLQGLFLKQTTRQLFSPVNLRGHKWALLLISLMIFLILLNGLGLLPYTFTPTTQLSVNLAFAVPLWLATVIIGLQLNPTAAVGHLLPEGSPAPLIPVLVIIETMSLLIRPLALGVRLTANLTAGHLLIHLIASGTIALLPTIPVVASFTFALLFLLSLLEMAVAAIQAYVFVLLISLYLQENV